MTISGFEVLQGILRLPKVVWERVKLFKIMEGTTYSHIKTEGEKTRLGNISGGLYNVILFSTRSSVLAQQMGTSRSVTNTTNSLVTLQSGAKTLLTTALYGNTVPQAKPLILYKVLHAVLQSTQRLH